MSKAFEMMKNRYYEVIVDAQKGSWSVKNRISDHWCFQNALFCVDQQPENKAREPETTITFEKSGFDGEFGKGKILSVRYTPLEGYDPVRVLHIRLYNKLPFIEVGWTVQNPFSYPIRVCKVDVVYAGELFDGQKVCQPHVLRSGAGAEPNRVEKGWEIDALNGAMLTYLDGNVRRTFVAGGLSYKDFMRHVDIRDGILGPLGRRARHAGLRNITVSCEDPHGKIIQPHATYDALDSVYMDFVTVDPFEAYESYGNALRIVNHAAPNAYDFPTLCGWMVSTKHLGENKPINNSVGLVDQTRLARERGLMKYTPLAVRLEPDTYCYDNFGNTQQGWWDDAHWRMYGPGRGHQPGGEPGSLQKPYDTFGKFCKAVKELGGIPFTYFQSSMPSNDFALAHPDWMLNKDISRLHYTHSHQMPHVRYDYTHPQFRAHCLRVWKRLRKAGLAGIKFDYPETAWAKHGGFADKSFTTTSAYREMYRLCREGLGDNAYIHERNLGGLAHEDTPRLDVTAGIVDLQRVWGDASHFEPEMASRIGLRWYKSRNVFLYYPDGKSFFMDGKPISTYKRRAFLTIMGFLSGRLEIGTSIGSMTDEMFYDVTRLFPMLKGEHSPRPVDMFTRTTHPSVYVYEVSPLWHQVMLINNNKTAKTISAPLSGDQTETGAIGLNAECSYHAFEFWTQNYVGKIKGADAVSLRLKGGEVAMISLRRVADHPQVISTNRHIMQGMMECHDITWSEASTSLRGKVDVVGEEEFVLTVACNGRTPKHCDHAEIRQQNDVPDLVDLVFCSSKNETISFMLSFE